MRSKIAERVVPVASVLIISILLVTTGIVVSIARAQDKPSGISAKVELTTDPSPAQKGSNTVRVKLSDSTGKPIPGAEVTVTFFMAAMPSMNMPEMKAVVNASDKGGGIYEGKGDLGSAGMWQVTVMAMQNGKTIATRKFSVKATGGV